MVMEKIFFPRPRVVPSVSADEPWVKELRVAVEKAVEEATKPLTAYLKLYKQYEEFANVDTAEYIKSKVKINRKDPVSELLWRFLFYFGNVLFSSS